MRKETKVKINGSDYVIKELSVGQMMPLLSTLGAGGDEATESQLELMKQSVYVDGQLLGEGVLELGVSTYMKMVTEVLVINGLDEGPEGKD